ncbi:RNase A-like domain-containing protein [Salipaludibacillus sp. LMS25]|jgi:hypothetical protein|uniref:RNase A-like domain-containing protein n=1 Tax=Salipaludibacillus sp. LMS25 TaxID=2924031 RepID=UPI0034E9793D
MEMHEAMDGGHLSVKDFSVTQLQHLPTHGTLTEVLQERSTEIKSTADPREEELAILEAERAAIEDEELARLEAEQAALEAEEARLAEQQAVEKVEEDKSWWSKTVSAVADTVEKAVDTVGNAASSAYNYVTENPAASLSAVVDFVPVVGNLKAGIEAATGYDPLTGRRLEPWERAVSGGAILGGAAVKGASKVAKFAKNADNVGSVVKQGDKSSLAPGGGLAAHELKGGHLIDRHIGKTDEQLLGRLKNNPKITGSSSFKDRATAERVADAVLKDPKNIKKVQKWLPDSNSRPTLPLKYKGDGEILGRSVTRNSQVIENVTNAKIILKKANNDSFILTGYPVK